MQLPENAFQGWLLQLPQALWVVTVVMGLVHTRGSHLTSGPTETVAPQSLPNIYFLFEFETLWEVFETFREETRAYSCQR